MGPQTMLPRPPNGFPLQTSFDFCASNLWFIHSRGGDFKPEARRDTRLVGVLTLASWPMKEGSEH